MMNANETSPNSPVKPQGAETRAYLNAPSFDDSADPALRFHLACVVTGGTISVFRYERAGVSVLGVDCFGYSPRCLASVALTRGGEVSSRRRAIPDHVFDLVFRCHSEWRRANRPPEWVYQEFDYYQPLTARRLTEGK